MNLRPRDEHWAAEKVDDSSKSSESDERTKLRTNELKQANHVIEPPSEKKRRLDTSATRKQHHNLYISIASKDEHFLRFERNRSCFIQVI